MLAGVGFLVTYGAVIHFGRILFAAQNSSSNSWLFMAATMMSILVGCVVSPKEYKILSFRIFSLASVLLATTAIYFAVQIENPNWTILLDFVAISAGIAFANEILKHNAKR